MGRHTCVMCLEVCLNKSGKERPGADKTHCFGTTTELRNPDMSQYILSIKTINGKEGYNTLTDVRNVYNNNLRVKLWFNAKE